MVIVPGYTILKKIAGFSITPRKGTLINIGIEVHIRGTIFAGTRVLDQRQNEQQVSEKYITEVENNFSDSLKVSVSAYSVYSFIKSFVLSSSAHTLPVDLLADNHNDISDSTLI